MAGFTLVIATYRRVEALRSTIRSVFRQTRGDWTALVVGDRCGDETAEALRAFKDPRIRYYNLPERFGEQSGPNTAGLHLASGDFVSFLNHDDLLVQDHLAHAAGRLAGADFFLGRFAHATRVVEGPEGPLPFFTRAAPRESDLDRMLDADPWLFDPSSFWVIRTPYARRVGPWRTAREVWRTPLRDWLIRAWRLGGRFVLGTRLTGLRFLTRAERTAGPVYATATPEHEVMAERLERESPDRVRAFVRAQLREELERTGGSPPRRPLWRRALRRGRQRIAAALYRGLGIDPESVLGPLAGRRKGELMDRLSRKRTDDALPARPSLAAFLADPEAYRVL